MFIGSLPIYEICVSFVELVMAYYSTFAAVFLVQNTV